MDKISTLFTDSGYKTFGKKLIGPKGNKSKNQTPKGNKPWYNITCRNKRVIFNRARKKYQITKSTHDLEAIKTIGKDYKNEILKSHRTHSDNIRREVRELRTKANKQDYWRYCTGKRKTESNAKIDFTEFTNFFKSLNTKNVAEKSSIFTNKINEQKPNDELDKDITEDETQDAILRLKNNKACGTDNVANEYIKSSPTSLLPVYKAPFNVIYTSGVIPETWTAMV